VCSLHHAAAPLAEEAAPVVLPHVALRPFDGELVPVNHLAADVHAAVAGPDLALELHLEAQLEIAVGLLTAQEGVVLGALYASADDGAALHAPELVTAFPPIEIPAVEERFGVAGLHVQAGTSGDDEERPQHQDPPEPSHRRASGFDGATGQRLPE